MRYARGIANWAGTGLLALAVMAVGGAGLSAAPAKLTMVGSWPPKVSSAADIGIKYLDTVNKMGKGTVEITFKGSRDVVPTFDQPEALVRGLFDVWYGAPNYWAGVVPGGYFFELSPYDVPDKGPGSDLYNFIVKMYEKKGVRYVGHFCGEPSTGNHFMYTQKKISGIGDLKGRKIRVPPLTRFFVKQIGAEPVTLPPSEVYLALERGTVEGFTWPYYDGFTALRMAQDFEICHRPSALPRRRQHHDEPRQVEQTVGRCEEGDAGRGRPRPGLDGGLGLGFPGAAAQGDAERRHEAGHLLRQGGRAVGDHRQRGALGPVQVGDERGRVRDRPAPAGIQVGVER